MEVMQALLERRSTKKFKPDPVPQEALEAIAKAGTYAASGMNKQSPMILCVTNKELRDRLEALNGDIMGINAHPYYGAPVVMVVLANKAIGTHVYDGSLVMGNMMLAAHSMGIGSCWIHRAKEIFESDAGKAILAELGIEGEWEGIGHCVLGYADGEPRPASPRKENYVYYVK